MKKVCTICGSSCYHIYVFKSGYVCEDCLQHLKSNSAKNSQVDFES